MKKLFAVILMGIINLGPNANIFAVESEVPAEQYNKFTTSQM